MQEVIRKAYTAYHARKAAEVAAELSTERGRLHHRILAEGGAFLFGKKPDTKNDYSILSKTDGLIEISYYTVQNLFKMIGPPPSPDAEMIIHCPENNDMIINSITEQNSTRISSQKLCYFIPAAPPNLVPAYITYNAPVEERDYAKRRMSAWWVVICPEDVRQEVVTYLSQNPADAFSFFNELIPNAQRYLQRDRVGKLYLANSANIPLLIKQKGYLDPRSLFVQMVSYPSSVPK